MAPNNLPAAFNATAQDIEMLLSAQCHIGSKNMQVHMEPYLWKTRPDGINVINIGKTWYVGSPRKERDIGEEARTKAQSRQFFALCDKPV
jgi:small subunit ribosomal protein SAe